MKGEEARHLAGSDKYTFNKSLINKETKTHQAKHFVTNIRVCLREKAGDSQYEGGWSLSGRHSRRARITPKQNKALSLFYKHLVWVRQGAVLVIQAYRIVIILPFHR